MRNEIKRFVYMCDGMEHEMKRCPTVEVIDACSEREADNIAINHGWKVNSMRCICNTRKHNGFLPLSRQARGLNGD